ncbi:MAG: TA system VapC family ribonuclease toxin [Mycobacteriales bacterium]
MMLLDVGVWLAAVSSGHMHHVTVAAWFQEQPGGLVMCRVTQMSLLRLLSNPAVMGDASLTRRAAWDVIDQLRADERIGWAQEPAHLELLWRSISARDDRSHKLWTDDYLAAFAQAAGASIVTLDRGFAQRYPAARVTVLS